MGFLIRVLLNAAAILFVASVVPGMEVNGIVAALGAGLVLGLVNAIVRPLLIILTLPITLLTLGLFILALNAFCLQITAMLVKGFTVSGFWPAVLGSILISFVSWMLTAFVSDHGRIRSINAKK